MAVSAVFATLNPLTYDADIRSTGVGWSIGMGRIGAILAQRLPAGIRYGLGQTEFICWRWLCDVDLNSHSFS